MFPSTHARDSYDVDNVLAWSDFKLRLPPRSKTRFRTFAETGWSSHYGGIEALASYAGMIPGIPVPFQATWQHGIIQPWRYKKYPLQLLYGIKHRPDRLILTCNNEQAEELARLGYSNVHPIGAPYVYAKPSSLPQRLASSVLLMPVHALNGAKFENEQQIEEYCDYAHARYEAHGKPLYACIHMSCIRNGQWVESFIRRGIPVIAGADHDDANSYKRMWHLFSLFDVVSSSGIGSHIYYALSAGCRVVVEGPKVSYCASQMLKDVSYRRSLANGEDILNDADLRAQERDFLAGFAAPISDVDLGNLMIGAACKMPPKMLRALLGWSRAGQLRDISSMICNRAILRISGQISRSV